MHLSDLFDERDFCDLQTEGYIRTQDHPTQPLRIANYTEKCQFDRAWNDVTSACRGLIYNRDTREVVARPWKKFHNWDESLVGKIPVGPMIKAPKMDGSLGILYPKPVFEGLAQIVYNIASRGSFASEQATRGTRMFIPTALKSGFAPREGYTYLFEIIYPENRIVVDYHGFEGLVLLDILDLETGLPDFAEFDACEWPHKADKTTVSDGFSVNLTHTIRDDEEGFVLYWPFHDLRVKMKGATYVALHRVLTQANARTVWEYLASGKTVQDLLGDLDVPDEFYAWLRKTASELSLKFNEVEVECQAAFMMAAGSLIHEDAMHHMDDREFRKQFAISVSQLPYKSVLFRMFDDQPYDDIIWKAIRPEATKPFWATEGEN